MNDDFLKSLNDRQLKAVLHNEGPALVLAGAGSGKTRVLTSRVARLLLNNKLVPEEILLVTFTNKAAAEMKKRVQDLTNNNLPFAGTFHSLATKMLRRYAHSLKLDNNFSIYDSDDQLALLKQIYKNNGWDVKEYKPQAVKAAISEAKNQLLTPEKYRESVYNDFGEFVANAYQAYQVNLKVENALDFDDLLNEALKMLKEDQYVRQFYQQQFKYVLIDEYQDTNKAQYQLSKILTQPEDNLFVVGDFSQSIYAWRGADYKNMLTLKDDFEKIATYHLDQNYRSTQPILTAATQVIQKNTDHPILTLWTENKDKSKIKVFDCETGQQEAVMVAKTIDQWRQNGKLSDCAILYRTNAQSRLFEEALTRYGLPYKLVGGFKFYERKEIKDVLAYLRLFHNPKESVSLQRVRKIGKRRLDKYLIWRDKAQNSEMPNNSPLSIIQEILQATDYKALYDEHDPEEMVKLENINELLTHASQFQTIESFLENVALIQDDYGPDGLETKKLTRDEVILMSLHSAKGLEFPVVFLVGMEENYLPHSRSLFNKEQLAEERRLCYVGITRAKTQLYLTYARRRWTYGGTNIMCRSRFIDDLAEDLLDIERLEEEYQEKNWSRKEPNWTKYQTKKPVAMPNSSRKLDLDDCQLSEVLNGELDYETFLRS